MLIYFLLFNKHKKPTDDKPLTRVFFLISLKRSGTQTFFGGPPPLQKQILPIKKDTSWIFVK